LGLLPEPRGRWLGGLPPNYGGERQHEANDDRQRPSKSGFNGPHHCHLTSPSNDAARLRLFNSSFQCRIRLSIVSEDCRRHKSAARKSTPWFSPQAHDLNQLTPSFFCRLDDDVVYWNTSRLSGKKKRAAFCAISAPSWSPKRLSS